MTSNNSASSIDWPRKAGEKVHTYFDSSLWNNFPFRDDDIVISTYGKSGTTWVQQIVGQLIFKGAEGINTAGLSPWVDMRLPPAEIKFPALEAQKHRRFLKTHLPVDALVYSPKAKYLFVARDGRDVLWSFYNHHRNFNDLWYETINGVIGPGIEPSVPTELNVREYFLEWIEQDGYPLWPFWHTVSSWWAIRHLPNLMLVHFSNLVSNLPGEIDRIANFLEIPVAEADRDTIIEHCGFEYMRANASDIVPMGGAIWTGGAKTFIHKGTNGRWRDELNHGDIARYESLANENLGAECAHWLATGEMPV